MGETQAVYALWVDRCDWVFVGFRLDVGNCWTFCGGCGEGEECLFSRLLRTISRVSAAYWMLGQQCDYRPRGSQHLRRGFCDQYR